LKNPRRLSTLQKEKVGVLQLWGRYARFGGERGKLLPSLLIRAQENKIPNKEPHKGRAIGPEEETLFKTR